MHQGRRVCLTRLMLVALVAVLVTGTAGCRRPRDGKNGSSGSNSPVAVAAPSSKTLTDTEDLPGLIMTVLSPAPTDNFGPGDRISVNFTLTRNDGSPIAITELDGLEAHISGPTFNYQRVIDETEIVATGHIADDAELVYNDDGSYTYTFVELPENYIDPPNSAGTFTTDVLSGTPLLSGTYTFVFIGYRTYSVGGKLFNDVTNVAQDFLLGDADTVEPRQVVAIENCNRCHIQLQMHDGGLAKGDIVRDTRLCVTCHVAGAEDMNDPTVAGGTPDVTVEFKVMIHKIHNGAHLPSVLGIGTYDTGANIGARNMTLPPKPYEIVNDELEVRDFSGVTFPVWPSFNIAMPRNYGYTLNPSGDPATTALSAFTPGVDKGPGDVPPGAAYGGTFDNYSAVKDTAPKFTSPSTAAFPLGNGKTWQANDTTTRTGVVACAKCHGDPDGAGPMAAPAQGNLITVQPTRRACGACHDDVNWSVPYTKNLKTMPPQPDDSHCIECHVDTAGGGTGSDPQLLVASAHTHPLTDPTNFPAPYNGLHLTITGLTPSGANALLEPGETLQMKFRVTNDAGTDVPVLVAAAGGAAIMQSAPAPANPTLPLTAAWGGQPFGTGSGYPWPETQSGWWNTVSCVLSGPTSNYNMINAVDFPTDMPAFQVPPSGGEYVMNMPQYLVLADFGNSVVPGTTLHNILGGSPTQAIYSSPYCVIDVEQVTGDTAGGAVSTVLSATVSGQNYVDVTHGAAPYFAKDQYIRIGGGIPGTLPAAYTADREFLRIGYVEALTATVDRLWFSSPYQTRGLLYSSEKTTATAFSTLYGPWVRKAHPTTAALNDVVRVTIANRAKGGATGWALTPTATTFQASSLIEGSAFVAGQPILVSYMTDFVLPANYPPAAFGGTDLGEEVGCWTGKAIVPGTYTAALWTRYPWEMKTDTTWPDWSGLVGWKLWANNIDYGYAYEVNAYGVTTPPSNTDLLVGNPAMPVVPAPLETVPFAEISSGDNCLTCHDDILFHGGGRRQFQTCVMCHGTAGIALHQNYVATPAAGLPAWDRGIKNTVNFRFFLHEFHIRDEDEDEPGGFPGMPDGEKNCSKCHGDPGDEPGVWEVPHDRDHPMGQVRPTREWMNACAGCHNTGDAFAHFDLMTSAAGEESCGTCHNKGATYGVGIMHKIR